MGNVNQGIGWSTESKLLRYISGQVQKVSNYLLGTKLAIKTSIENKGVIVDDTVSFREYADKIMLIETGTDISDADAAVGEVLSGKTFYSIEEPRKTGTMPNRGEVDTDITTADQVVTIEEGYHNGSGTVQIDATEQAKIIAENIKKDIAILGVTGTLESSGGTDPVIRYYTSGATWTKPAGLSHALVLCIGGGGGGASGARRAADTATRGGGGGGAGIPMRRMLTAEQLGETETIVVGAGGAGGASQTTDDSANVAGSSGGDTSFGSLVLSQGANGAPDTGSLSPTRVITNQVPPQESHSIHRSDLYGGLGSSTTGGTGSSSVTSYMSANASSVVGGASGGGVMITNAQTAGGAGGRAYNAANTQSAEKVGGTAGGGAGADGHDNYCDQLLLSYGGFVTTHGYGTSGAGGGSANAAAGGKGGNGGNYGAGGGGGGASRNGYASGAGGDGGDGLCIVMEFYGA